MNPEQSAVDVVDIHPSSLRSVTWVALSGAMRRQWDPATGTALTVQRAGRPARATAWRSHSMARNSTSVAMASRRLLPAA